MGDTNQVQLTGIVGWQCPKCLTEYSEYSRHCDKCFEMYKIFILLEEVKGILTPCGDILNKFAEVCHQANLTWWHDPVTGKPLKRNKGELLALIHSEISEALEGERKNLMDDHLPNRPMAEVELADALIRIFDYAAGFGYDIGGAFVEKMIYNAKRSDHKPENRANGGKQF